MKMVVERVTDTDRRELHCKEMHFCVEVEEYMFFHQETDSHLKIRLEVFR